MMRTPLVAIALATTSLAVAEPMTTTPVGRIFHYLRTNIDGSEPEHVRVFRRDANHIEVYKMVEKCTNAALVTAELNLDEGFASRLVGGRLQPNAQHREFAYLDHDAEYGRLKMRMDLENGSTQEEIDVTDAPFHIFDFDLADFTIFGPALSAPRKTFAHDLVLIWPNEKREPFLRFLGKATFTFKGEEVHDGKRALRFDAGGPAFGGKGGPIWFDKAQGHIIDVEWGIPNHAEYNNFKLKLIDIDDGGEAAWTKVLTAQYAGCTASE